MKHHLESSWALQAPTGGHSAVPCSFQLLALSFVTVQIISMAVQETALVQKLVWFNRVGFANRMSCHGLSGNQKVDAMWACACSQPDIVSRMSDGEQWILFKTWIGHTRDWEKTCFRPKPARWVDLPYPWMRAEAANHARLIIDPRREV